MSALRHLSRAVAACVALLAFAAVAAEYPAPKQGTFIAKDFRFQSGEVLPELKLHYRTIGEPNGEPVVVLHGTAGSGASMLTPAFAGELFGEGQVLDAKRHYIILLDAIGHGGSSKPSDGMKTRFPRYTSEDMVDAQHRLLTEGLGLKRVRVIIGNSMGGMHVWLWGGRYPDFADALVPMVSQPFEMASRNWMLDLRYDLVRGWPRGGMLPLPHPRAGRIWPAALSGLAVPPPIASHLTGRVSAPWPGTAPLLAGLREISSGVPWATIVPPPSPP